MITLDDQMIFRRIRETVKIRTKDIYFNVSISVLQVGERTHTVDIKNARVLEIGQTYKLI